MNSLDDTNGALLMVADSERNADMYYATGFVAPDPFVFIQSGGEKVILVSDLELDRAKAQARVDQVIPMSRFEEAPGACGSGRPGIVEVVDAVLRDRGIRSVLVPGAFPIEYADQIRARGYRMDFRGPAFFEERETKSTSEVAAIQETLSSAEEVLEEAIQVISDSRIGADGLLYAGGRVLTAEAIKRVMGVRLIEKDCICRHTIVACGDQGCDPHNEGSGLLRAHKPIIIDLFPVSSTTRYYADITRTVVRGRASDELNRMYTAVEAAQEIVFRSARAEARAESIHAEVQEHFKSLGFESGEIGGRMQGFFHGTGHGVGLEIHEPPRISKRPGLLKSGHVVTVEPGLYYLGQGGVRLEDMIVIGDDGCTNLTEFPKMLVL